MADNGNHDQAMKKPINTRSLTDPTYSLDNAGDIQRLVPAMVHGKTRRVTRRLAGSTMEATPLEPQEPEIQAAELQKRAEDHEVEQAALFEATLLESKYLGTLAVYVEAKQEQVERLEDRLENAIEQQLAKLQQTQSMRPGLLAMPGTRATWQQQQARQQARIQCLQNRLENVREIKEGMDIHGPKIEGLAARKLRVREPELAADWDSLRLAQRHHQAIQRKKQEPEQQQQARSHSLGQEGVSSRNGRNRTLSLGEHTKQP